MSFEKFQWGMIFCDKIIWKQILGAMFMKSTKKSNNWDYVKNCEIMIIFSFCWTPFACLSNLFFYFSSKLLFEKFFFLPKQYSKDDGGNKKFLRRYEVIKYFCSRCHKKFIKIFFLGKFSLHASGILCKFCEFCSRRRFYCVKIKTLWQHCY